MALKLDDEIKKQNKLIKSHKESGPSLNKKDTIITINQLMNKDKLVGTSTKSKNLKISLDVEKTIYQIVSIYGLL